MIPKNHRNDDQNMTIMHWGRTACVRVVSLRTGCGVLGTWATWLQLIEALSVKCWLFRHCQCDLAIHWAKTATKVCAVLQHWSEICYVVDGVDDDEATSDRGYCTSAVPEMRAVTCSLVAFCPAAKRTHKAQALSWFHEMSFEQGSWIRTWVMVGHSPHQSYKREVWFHSDAFDVHRGVSLTRKKRGTHTRISDVTFSVIHLLIPGLEWRLPYRGVALNYTPICQTETSRLVHRSGSALAHGGSLWPQTDPGLHSGHIHRKCLNLKHTVLILLSNKGVSNMNVTQKKKKLFSVV